MQCASGRARGVGNANVPHARSRAPRSPCVARHTHPHRRREELACGCAGGRAHRALLGRAHRFAARAGVRSWKQKLDVERRTPPPGANSHPTSRRQWITIDTYSTKSRIIEREKQFALGDLYRISSRQREKDDVAAKRKAKQQQFK